MKRIFLISLAALLPLLGMAQVEDDLYFVPKKKTAKKQQVSNKKQLKSSYQTQGRDYYVKDKTGRSVDVDNYNRRYTSRENNFTRSGDTLYIDEKPYGERGEWINGFEGSQSDYEYAMRLVRFRNPRVAVPVSSPAYWDIVYALPSWEWNVYVDDFYAYAVPTTSNMAYWDYRHNYPYGSSFSINIGWHNPWSHWYSPWHGYWGGSRYWAYNRGYWDGYYDGMYGYPYYGGYYGGAYWGGRPHGWYGSTRHNPGVHADRYVSNYRRGGGNYSTRTDRNGYRNSERGSYYRNNRKNSSYTRSRRNGRYTRNRGSYTRNTGNSRYTGSRNVGTTARRNAYRNNTTTTRNRNNNSGTRYRNTSSRSNNSSYTPSRSRNTGGGTTRSRGGGTTRRR